MFKTLDEQHLQALIDGIKDHAILMLDPQGRVASWTTCAERIKGYKAEEVIGKSFTCFYTPEDLEREHPKDVLGVAEEMGHLEEEGWRVRKDGSRFWASVMITALRDESGRLSGFSKMTRDITELKKSQEKLSESNQMLLESEERFRMIADGCPSALWMTGPSGEIQFVNRAYCEMMGVTFEEVQGDRVFMHPEDAALANSFQSAIRERVSFSVELRVRRADGEWRWIASTGHPRFSVKGEFLGHVGLGPDITDRKKIEIQLRELADRLAMATRAGKIGIWDQDPVLDVLVWDDQMFSLYGRTREKFNGNFDDWRTSLHPDDLESAVEEFRRGLAGEKDFVTEFRVVWPDGSVHDIRALSLVQRDESGQPLRIVGTNWDITEQKKAEQELLNANQKLLKATASANQLAFEASSANAAKTRFLANMSHEIRTPMNGVIGMIQLLLESDLTAEQHQFATVARESGRSLLRLIDDILDLSKIEAGKVTLEKRRFELRESIEGVLRLLSVQANAKGLAIHSQVSPEIPHTVAGDGHRLSQILTNLMSNAIKFTERGQVNLAVVLERQGCGEVMVRFSITDSGIGIRPDQAVKLFSPFTQADSSTTRIHGGTGLGLVICKQLAEMMGGTIGVESREGYGSTFWFTAVFERVKSDPHAESESERKASVVKTRIGRDARILVVDDNHVNRMVVTAQLHKLGYKADSVTNGVESIQAVEKGIYDMVLMDCQMPVMDGFEATNHIRKALHRDIPIIALTASAMAEDREKCVDLGMNDMLPKPVDLWRLSEVLDSWIPVKSW